MMKRKDKRPDVMPFQFWLILGLFIACTLLNLLFMIFVYGPKEFMFWICMAGALFFAITAYCWVDEDRLAKYEYYGMPAIYGLFFLMLVAFTIIGLVYYTGEIIKGDFEWVYLPVAIFALAGLGTFAYFTFRFFLQPYFKKRNRDDRKKEE